MICIQKTNLINLTTLTHHVFKNKYLHPKKQVIKITIKSSSRQLTYSQMK